VVFEQAYFINFAFDATSAYNDLPLLPPARHVGEPETVAVLKACVQARVALAELNQICRHFPNQTLLWRILPLLEAYNSARIGGHDADITELLKLPLDPSSTRHSDELPQLKNTAVAKALAIHNAIDLGYELVGERSLNVSMLLELASVVESSPVSVRRGAGTALLDPGSDEVLYTPPLGAESIQRLLGNWESFVHVDAGNLDPLVLTAIAHYQLSAIAPFSSAAGSLCRLVDGLLLAEEDLLSAPVLGLSAWFYRNRQDYIRLQAGVSREQRWQDWLQFYLKGVTHAAQMQARRLNVLTELMQTTQKFISAKEPKVATEPVLNLLFTHPCIRIHSLVSAGIARRQTASIYLKKLCELGVLEETPYGKEKLFVHTRLVQLLVDDDLQYSSYPG